MNSIFYERSDYMFCSIEEAIADLQAGKIVIVVDDEDRENEGDFVALSEHITPETINFMITHGKGLVCTTITEEHAEKLHLSPMTHRNTDPYHTAFTVSIDHHDTTTRISAFERAQTIHAMTKKNVAPSEFKQPGHVFPLIAKNGGVFQREGHTEASVDLAKLSDAFPSSVICEIIKENGEMARVPDLQRLSEKFNMKIITIKELINYRKKKEFQVRREVVTTLPTIYGIFKVYGYKSDIDGKEHLALVKGDIHPTDVPIVRVHSECMTGDVFSSYRCDCGPQLNRALKTISEAGKGVCIYLRQEGRGIGLFNKLRAYELQDKGLDTVEANLELGFQDDAREYDTSALILKDLGIQHIQLLTNNPRKIAGLTANGIHVQERIPLEVTMREENSTYMKTKQTKLGHVFTQESV